MTRTTGCEDDAAATRDVALCPHLALVGATASGKTALAVALARRRGDLELVSADAMAVYRGLDIGTAKPSPAERDGLTWHLLDLVEASAEYSVAEFQAAAGLAFEAIEARRHGAVLVGGSGLYHRAVLDGLTLPGRFPDLAAELSAAAAPTGGLASLYQRLVELDPVAASRIEATNERRVVRALEVTLGSGRRFSEHGPGLGAYGATRFTIVGLRLPRDELAARIAARLEGQLAAGFLEEVRQRRRRGPVSRTAAMALGYRELLEVIDGRATLEEAKARITKATFSFAKRQEAWFGRDPRIVWLDARRDDLLDALDGVVERPRHVEG